MPMVSHPQMTTNHHMLHINGQHNSHNKSMGFCGFYVEDLH
jgi:hypothetical protein